MRSSNWKTMIGRETVLLAVLTPLLLLALPGTAPGKTVTYKGKITRGAPDYEGRAPGGGTVEFKVTFKGKPGRGKPVRVGFVQVHQPPWGCQPGATGQLLAQNQRIRFGEWSPLGQGSVWTRVDRAGQFSLGTPPGQTLEYGVFRSHELDGEFRGKKAKKATGEVDLELGELAPEPDEPDYPGDPSMYRCVVDHEWVAKRQ